MKKILYSMFAMLALTCSFAACSDDDEDESISYSTTAEKASAGTYSGTWTRTSDTDVITFDGTVTLAATDSVGCTNVTVAGKGVDGSNKEVSINSTCVANVWNSGYGFQFVNQVGFSDLGTSAAPFAGRIDEKGKLTTSFTVEQRNGRKLVKYVYDFVGNK